MSIHIRNPEDKVCSHCGERNHPVRRLCWSCGDEIAESVNDGFDVSVTTEADLSTGNPRPVVKAVDKVEEIIQGALVKLQPRTDGERVTAYNIIQETINAAVKTIREGIKSQERWTGGTLMLRMEQVGANGLADEINAELTSMVSMFEYSLAEMTQTANSFDKKAQELGKVNEAAHDQLAEAYQQNKELRDSLARFEAFRDFVHRRLDTASVPKEFPDGEHTLEGCRIGDRLDWVFSCLAAWEKQFPMQRGPSIPWKLAELLYVGYSAQYGTQQSLERLAERGGFSWREIDYMWEKVKLFRPAIEKAQAANPPPKPADEIWESEIVDFWKRMFTRAKCGCLALDCRVHGSYDPADVKRVQEAILHE